MSHVFKCKPQTMDQLKGLVADFATNMSRDLIRKVCGSTCVRFKTVKAVGGVILSTMSSVKFKNINKHFESNTFKADLWDTLYMRCV